MADSQVRPDAPSSVAAAVAARRQLEQQMNAAHGPAAETASYGVAPESDRGPGGGAG